MKGLLFFGLCGLLASPSLMAQLNSRIVAEIPFDFYVGNQHFAKGAYEVVVDVPNMVVKIASSTDSRYMGFSTVMPVENPVGGDERAKIVFKKYDSEHTYLRTAVWGPHSGPTLAIVMSRGEKEHVTSKLVTVSKNQVETLTVLARVR